MISKPPSNSAPHTSPPRPDRRAFLGATAASGAAVAAVTFASTHPAAAKVEAIQLRPPSVLDAAGLGVLPDTGADVTALLQNAIATAAASGARLQLAAGQYAIRQINLPDRAMLAGVGPATVLVALSSAPAIASQNARDIRIEHMALDGGGLAKHLIALTACRNVTIDTVAVIGAQSDNIHLTRCSGRVTHTTSTHAGDAGLHALDSAGLAIANNAIGNCRNNGIQVWRTTPGPDGTIVSGNRISDIANDAGGSGQYGNGINIFRADGCIVSGNIIDRCSYSAIRGNAASNLQIIGNTAHDIGEVAIYAEFAFEGVVIANNIVDRAASGISVTNFNDGGRLGVVQGNLVRNLRRREFESVDKRGVGISVEADASVTGNTIEGAATAGIMVGWGRFVRDCTVTGNTVRASRSGILISDHTQAGACLVANNVLSGMSDGGIRMMRGGMPSGPELAASGTGEKRLAVIGNLLV